MTAVAVLGLGTMGGRVAAALAVAGHDVRGFDPAEGAGEAAGRAGVTVLPTAEAAVAGCAAVVLSLPRPEHVLAVAEGPLGSLTGGVVADLSTIDPTTARRAAAVLSEHGVRYADAPVLGRPAGIGRWTLPVGADEATAAEVAALLQGPVARLVTRVGDVGAGSVVKLANNLMFGAINAVTAEALALCRGAGVEPEAFVAALAGSGAATVSGLFGEVAPKMLDRRYEPSFALGLLAKDNRLALQLARESGVRSPMAELVDRLNGEALDLGHGADDTAAVQELFTRHPGAGS